MIFTYLAAISPNMKIGKGTGTSQQWMILFKFGELLYYRQVDRYIDGLVWFGLA